MIFGAHHVTAEPIGIAYAGVRAQTPETGDEDAVFRKNDGADFLERAGNDLGAFAHDRHIRVVAIDARCDEPAGKYVAVVFETADSIAKRHTQGVPGFSNMSWHSDAPIGRYARYFGIPVFTADAISIMQTQAGKVNTPEWIIVAPKWIMAFARWRLHNGINTGFAADCML
jgi:hypothetical protein